MAFKELVLAGVQFEGFPGPRDWSPAIDLAKGRLKALQTLVPEGFLVPFSEVRDAGFWQIAEMVEQGFAFVFKMGKLGHTVYVSPKGRIHMDLTVKNFFKGLTVVNE